MTPYTGATHATWRVAWVFCTLMSTASKPWARRFAGSKVHLGLSICVIKDALGLINFPFPVLEDTSHQIRPKIDAGDASLLMGSIN
jgi:hypothetical protein